MLQLKNKNLHEPAAPSVYMGTFSSIKNKLAKHVGYNQLDITDNSRFSHSTSSKFSFNLKI